MKRLQECANAIAKEAVELQRAAGKADSVLQPGKLVVPALALAEQPGNPANLSKITLVVDGFLVEVLATSLRGNLPCDVIISVIIIY